MLRQQIDAILEAENEAKRRLTEAHAQAKSIVADAHASRAPYLEESRNAARRDARALVERGRAETQRDREQLLSEARLRAETYGDDRVPDGLVQQAVSSIAGLPP